MRIVPTFTLAAALASSAFLTLPVSAVEVCDTSCIGPLCNKNCVREPNATVGRGDRDERVIIEERNRRREPGVVIEERYRRPGVEIEVGR